MTEVHQRSLFELRHARRHDPATSALAAAQAHGIASEHERAILHAARLLTDWTAPELAARCGLSSVQVSRRLKDLLDAGLIVETGEMRPTPSGRAARVFAVRTL